MLTANSYYHPIKVYYLFKKLYILLLFMLLLAGKTHTQENVLYYMYDVPQTLLLNPANEPPCRFYIELPVLSKFYLGFHNTGFGEIKISEILTI